jgi:hypothetical protein
VASIKTPWGWVSKSKGGQEQYEKNSNFNMENLNYDIEDRKFIPIRLLLEIL